MHARVARTDHPLTQRALAKQQTRQKVLAKARELFRSRGYAGTTIRDIAAEIGMSIGAVFSNFPSKGALFREVIFEEYEGYRHAREALSADMGIREQVVAVLAIDYKPDRLGFLRSEMELSWSTEGAAASCSRADYVGTLLKELLPPWNTDVIERFVLDVWALHLELCRTQRTNQEKYLHAAVVRAMRRTS